MKRINAYLSASLTLTIAICFFLSCSGDSGKTTAKAPEENTTNSAPSPAETAPATQDTANTPETPAGATAETSPATTPETNPPAPASTGGSNGLSGRTVSENKLTTVLETVAREMEALNLAYRSDLGQDCSGIYHQLKDSVQARIPALANKDKYIYPTFQGDRSSRQVADWYHRHNNLLIVQDGMAERNKIRPGCVMFFGRTDEKYTNITIDLLTNPGKFVHDGTKGKIMHVAVVTSIEKDEQGNVTKYTMMHGRNTKYPASRTGANYDGTHSVKKQFDKFPFGNWNQQWVAMANIETPK